MKKLREQRVLAAGTFSPTRKDLPIELNKECELQKGQHLWWSKGCVSATQWHDNKNVHAMSNYHDPQEVIEVTWKHATGAKVGVSCPKVLSDHNKWTGVLTALITRGALTQQTASQKSGGVEFSTTCLTLL